MELEFFASCLGGLEQALARELASLGIRRIRPLGGGVAFFCTPDRALRACLWSRLASRIVLVISRVNAGDADLLYAGAYDTPWEEVMAEGATFAVRAHGSNDQLRNTRFTALKVKDAVMDRLRCKQQRRAQVDAESPRAVVDVRIRERRATLSLDFSGEALNHRAYLCADDKKDAPLACSIAAGALALGGWDSPSGGDGRACALVDPVCQDGIMLVEAASVACDLAPGLARERWGFEGWAGYERDVWAGLVEEARRRFETGLGSMGADAAQAASGRSPDLSRVRIAGASTSSPAIARARDRVKRAGLRQVVSVELADAASVAGLVSRIAKVAGKAAAGHDVRFAVASSIDAAARGDAAAQIVADELAYAAACSAAPAGARFIAAGAQGIDVRFGEGAASAHVLGSARAQTRIAVYGRHPLEAQRVEVPDLKGGPSRFVDVLEAGSDQFAARLRKVFKERRKWAAREGVSCYRVYDADLPDYAVAIDWYAGAGDARNNSYLHVAEYAAPSSVDAGRAARRFSDVLAIAPIVCGVRPDHVFSKRRQRDKGGSQYRNAGHRSYPTTVEEAGQLFEVDLAARLDTGLFLDHRLTRALVREQARGKRFLNLFAYTGTASVYAASGGASCTTTVDLSQTYLDWARRNMAANGFTGAAHEFVRADVVRWITEARRARRTFDLIFVDPPTFSNSKAMGKKSWDVQRDHVELLIGVVHLLAPGGQAVFSCNLRSFKPSLDELARYGVDVRDISQDTIPLDFARTPKIHKCYIVRRAEAARAEADSLPKIRRKDLHG